MKSKLLQGKLSQNKVIQNATWIIGAKVVQSLLGLLISMLTARFLGPSNFGVINYAKSIVAFAAPIMQLGITSILVQEFISEPDKEGELLGTSILSCFGSALLSIAGIAAFVSVANASEPEVRLVCALYSLTLLAQALEVIVYWFQAHLLSKYSATVSLASYMIVSLYQIYLLVTQKEVYWFAISNALDFLLIAIALIVLYHKLGGQKLTFSFTTCKRLINKGKYYILSGLMITVFAQTDRIMLKLMINDAATGFYSAAVSCAGMTGFVVVAIIDSARPSIFESKKVSQQAFEKNMIRLYSVIIYFALLQSVGITVFAKWIVYILYGKAYAATIPALRIIVWYTTFSYLGAVRNIWMLAEGKQSLIWRIDISGAFVNILLNLILIPVLGINGASIASLLTQMIANVLVVGLMRETRPNIVFMAKSLNPKIMLELLQKIRK